MKYIMAYLFIFTVVPLFVFIMANDVTNAIRDEVVVAMQQARIERGEDPTKVLGAPAAGVPETHICENESFLYGKSSDGYRFVMSHAEKIFAVSKGERTVFMEWDELGYSVSELSDVNNQNMEYKEMEDMLATCLSSKKRAMPVGIRLH